MASIRKRGENSYQITVSCGRDIHGKKIIETVTYQPDKSLTPKKREQAVADFARVFEKQVEDGEAMDGRKITLLEFTERWKTEWAETHLHPRTVEDYMRELDDKILPQLGHKKLTELRRAICSYLVTSTERISPVYRSTQICTMSSNSASGSGSLWKVRIHESRVTSL